MSGRVEGDDGPGSHAVLLGTECRPLRRALRPLVWVTLEEVALDAVVEDGRLVARTSARQIAGRLGLDPTTVASALKVLRQRGLVTLEREKGPAGRFGLSVYQLGTVPGVTVVSPGAADPCVVSPHVVRPVLAEPGMVAAPSVQPCRDTPPLASSDTVQPCVGPPDMEGSDVVAPDSADVTPGRRRDGGRAGGAGRSRSRPSSPLSQCLGQTAFDLGSESS
ncbi:MAG TPA: winged helix-turn-helix transcriptional regulator [Acidimicrobiales bacterium]|nr:winged helix-turn-helix transcriptional regulator [Acidimicrobiales bacterium]